MEMLINHEPESPLIPKLREAKRLIRRGVVEQIYNIGFGVLKDVLEGDEDEAGIDPVALAAPALPQPIEAEEDEEDEAEIPGDEIGNGKRRFSKRRGKLGRYMGTPRR
jgi:hypothetical protein